MKGEKLKVFSFEFGNKDCWVYGSHIKTEYVSTYSIIVKKYQGERQDGGEEGSYVPALAPMHDTEKI